jgi:Fic family protein
MRQDDFVEPAGDVVQVPRGVAFVPATLPPLDIAYPITVLRALSEAEHHLGRLDGIGQRLPDPNILISPFLRREAVLSNKIEGTHSSYSDVLLFEAATRTNDTRDGSAQQVVNYVEALDYAFRQCRLSRTITVKLVCDIHRRLMAGASGMRSSAGHLRHEQVHVRGGDISVARYVPPPPEYLDSLMSNFERFVNTRTDLPLLIWLALIHYQFEAIHPFADGNGRVGRLLITLLLCTERRLLYPLLYLSAYFERNSAEYYDRLLAVSQRSEWVDWIIFFVNGVREEAKDAVNRTAQLFNLHEKYKMRFVDSRASAPTKLIDKLFETPVLTIPWAQQILSVSYPSAKQVVKKLMDTKILRPVDYPARAQYYVADEIVDIIEQPTVAEAVG